MEILLVSSIILLLTLLVPAFASADDDVETRIRATEERSRRSKALQLQQAQQLVGILEKQGNALDVIAAKNDLVLLQQDQEVEKAKDKLKAANDLVLTQQQLGIENDKHLKFLKDRAADDARHLADLQQATKQLEKQNKISEEAADNIVDGLAGMLGISDKWEKGIVGSFINAAKHEDGFAAGLEETRAKMKATFTTANVMASILAKVAEATLAVAVAQDQAMASFTKATGANEGYVHTIESTFLETRHLGVSMEEAGAALTSLYTQMADFTTLSPQTQAELVKNVALMNEFGISTEVSSEALDTMTRVLGMSAGDAAELSIELVNMAESIGVPPSRLMQELSSTAPMLAHWGGGAVDVFMELSQAAKVTGIEVGNLIGIASQFDTFEGAAEAAGRLNAVLGGPYLNSIELLNANEEERIRMLIQTIELSGRSWESMGRFEKQAVAAAAGINDMSEASRIFGMSLSAYDQGQRAAEENAAAQQDLADRAAEAQTVFDMLGAAMNSFAIMVGPFVKFLKMALVPIAAAISFIFASKFNTYLLATVAIVTALAIAWWAVSAVPIVAMLTGVVLVILAVIAALEKFTCFLFGCSPDGLIPGLDLAAENMKQFTASARSAKPALRDLNMQTGRLTVGAGSLMASKAGNTDMTRMMSQLIKSNEATARRLEQVANKETVLKLNDREFGRATKNVINKEMRLDKAAI